MRVLAWRIVGGLFTAFVVLAVAVTAYEEIEWRRDVGGSAPSWLVSQQRTETLTEVYVFTSQTLVVRASDNVRVNVEPGEEGRLTIRREFTYSEDPPDLRQFWNGRTLRIEVTCPAECGATYTLSVPETVEVDRTGTAPIAPGIP
jgi:hypothetical protein